MLELLEKLSVDIFQMENDLLSEYEKVEKVIDDNTGCVGRMVLDDFTKFCVDECCHLKAKRQQLAKLKFLIWTLINQYQYGDSFLIFNDPTDGKVMILPKRLLVKEGSYANTGDVGTMAGQARL